MSILARFSYSPRRCIIAAMSRQSACRHSSGVGQRSKNCHSIGNAHFPEQTHTPLHCSASSTTTTKYYYINSKYLKQRRSLYLPVVLVRNTVETSVFHGSSNSFSCTRPYGDGGGIQLASRCARPTSAPDRAKYWLIKGTSVFSNK